MDTQRRCHCATSGRWIGTRTGRPRIRFRRSRELILQSLHARAGIRYTAPTFQAEEGMSVQTKRGFTLVELLVVIGIIAVLIGVLLPALHKARQQGQTTQCLSNERQLCQAVLQYTHDYKGHCFPYNYSPSQILWQVVILPYIAPQSRKLDLFSTNPSSQAAIAQLQLRETVYFCPVAREPLSGGANTVAGSAFNCWGPA